MSGTDRTDDSGNTRRTAAGPEADAAGRLMDDWTTIWQSELAAMAGDPEGPANWPAMAAWWSQVMWSMTDATLARGRGAGDAPVAPGRAGPDAAAGPAPAPDASAASDAAIQRLCARVADLERRLAALERPAEPAPRPAPKAAPKPAARKSARKPAARKPVAGSKPPG